MMNVLSAAINKLAWGKTKIRRQMHVVYFIALLIPLFIVGMLLISYLNSMLTEHYLEVLEADNRRVKTLLSEITTQAYNISEEVCFDRTLKNILTKEYENSADFASEANAYTNLDTLVYNALEIKDICIYSDNPTLKNYKQFRLVTDEIASSEWYQSGIQTTKAFWAAIEEKSAYGSQTNNMCLVRQITLSDSEYSAVVVIRIKDSYIRSRIDSNSVIDAISIDDKEIVYSSKRNWYGKVSMIDIDYEEPFYRYAGISEADDTQYFVAVSTIHLYMTNSKMYICTLNSDNFADIKSILTTMIMILVFAIFVPGLILAWFADYFAGRVNLLREEIHKASLQDYNMTAKFSGQDELAEAYEDLKFMVQDIKDKDAKMYEAELNEKELRNNQQIMEYKMLASQINPHYLYNTLETIRMKSLTSGNREVADSIKILGKTLHYVLENTGTSSTTLQKEIEHVENYLSIQKLRFGNRINYRIEIEEDVNPAEYSILPLLLQPVVENAVVHGLENLNEDGQIYIGIFLTDKEMLRISVCDNGGGMTPETLEELQRKLDTPELNPRSSIGLYNINQRIRLCYGQEYGMKLESEYGTGTRVILYIPAILDTGI